MTDTRKPIIHARDHMPGGADPIDWDAVGGGVDSALPGLGSVLVDLGVGHLWKFDDASGTSAHDDLGGKDQFSSNNGNSSHSIAWGQAASPPGTASMKSVGKRWNTSAFTDGVGAAGVWVQVATANIAGFNPIMGQGYPERAIIGAAGWQINCYGHHWQMDIAAGTNANITDSDTPIGDTWYLVGMSYSGTVFTFYVNGQPKGTATISPSIVHHDVWFCDDGQSYIGDFSNGLLAWGFTGPTAIDDAGWAAIYANSFPFASDGNVLTADGAGGTKWRAAAGTGGIDVSFTGTELVIDGSAVTGTGISGVEVYVNGA